jgi:hypothetical protein
MSIFSDLWPGAETVKAGLFPLLSALPLREALMLFAPPIGTLMIRLRKR